MTYIVTPTEFEIYESDSKTLAAKVSIFDEGGVAVYGAWNGKDPFYTHWAPVPKRRTDA